MRNYVITFVAATLILSGCGCKTSKKSVSDEHYPLVGTQWNLVKLEGAEIGVDFALRPFITADNIQGNLGCNTFYGTYSVNKKHKMTLEFRGATKRLCQNMGVERKFMQALKRDITRYEIVGEELVLFAGDQEVMRFTGVDLSKVE